MADKLTIAFPTSSFLPGLGGVEVGLHNIVLRMQARGHRPIVMVTAPHHAALQLGDFGEGRIDRVLDGAHLCSDFIGGVLDHLFAHECSSPRDKIAQK